jgi:hypothetical protein
MKFGVYNFPLKCRLILVLRINKNELSQTFIDYDTKYSVNGEYKHYPLPEGNLILLLFAVGGSKLIPTVRRFYQRKFDYYKKLEGKIVELVVENEQD